MIRVELLTTELEERYRRFLLRNPRTLIHATIEYRNFLTKAIGGEPIYLLAIEEEDHIVGALPLFRLRLDGVGEVVNSLPWYGSHGGCVGLGTEAETARTVLLEHYRGYLASPSLLLSTIVLTPEEESHLDRYQALLLPTAYDRRIGQVTELPMGSVDLEACLEKTFHQKTRNLVRKALKQGFQLVCSDSDAAWRFLHSTHVENMLAIGGKSKPWEHFEALRTSFSSTNRSLWLAELGGTPVAALLLLNFNQTVEYVTPVVKHEYRSMQPLSFLIWHAMIDFARRGYRWWNWGGTWLDQQSLHHFKAGWGAADMHYSYLINATDAGRRWLVEHKLELGRFFPYYYVYPYDQL